MTKTMKSRICPECGDTFEVSSLSKQVFCCAAHKQAHANRCTVRGKALVRIAQGWRYSRGSGDIGKFLFAEMTAMLDQWNSEDLERTDRKINATDYAASVVQFNSLNPQWSLKYADRQNGQERKGR